MSRLRTTRALLVGCGTTGVEQTQLDGFYMHRAALYEELGLVFRRVDTRDLGVLEEVLLRSHEDVAFVMVPWSHPVEDVVLLFRELRGRTRPKIVFLDYFAQTSSPYFAVLPYVDLYAKRQLLRDRGAYARPMHGGYVFTDYLVKKQGYDIGSWHFGGPIPKEHAWKVRSAWNLGVKPIYRRMLRQNALDIRDRPIDLNVRLSFRKEHADAPWEWYQEYRLACARRVRSLEDLVLSSSERLGYDDYLSELKRSRLVLSPFGWGELCIRDFETIAAGALLLKPSMAHVETDPDLFRPGETYVPLAWDLSDLEEKVRFYLDNPEKARRIIRLGRRTFRAYFDEGRFVKRIGELLDALAERRRPTSDARVSSPLALGGA